MDDIFSASELLKTFLVFGTSFVFTFVVIPFVIRITNHDLGDAWLLPQNAKPIKMPALGGLTIFLSIIITICFWVPFDTIPNLQFYLSGLFIILILGIKDDFEPLGPFFKLLIQFCAAGVLVFLADLYVSDYKNLIGVHIDSRIVQQLTSMIFIVFLINIINFIDGINGLCGAITVLIAMALGSYFLLINENSMSYISMALGGSVFAFLYFNITPARIFMGDTGSLTIGTIIAILSITFLNIKTNNQTIAITQSPSFLFSILSIPLIDGIRVILGRIIKLKSPFKKDNSHIHHILLNKGFTHMQSTSILLVTNVILILLAYNLQHIGHILLIALQLLVIIILFVALVFKKPESYKVMYKTISK